ncbi:MAG: HAMP domain-containing sensor histidine kinase [Verrucomicrobiota bacterium]
MQTELVTAQQPSGKKIRPARLTALPLWLQIVGWFFLNIVLLVSVAALVLTTEFKPVLGALMEGKAGHRLSALAGEVTDALSSRTIADWPEVMDFFAQTYQIQCALFRQDGAWMAGEVPQPPPSVVLRLRENEPRSQVPGISVPPGQPIPPGQPFPQGQQPPPNASQPPPPRQLIPGLKPPPPPPGSGHFVIHEDGLYWIGVHLHRFFDERGRRGPSTLLLASPTPQAGGLLLQFTPWWIAVLVLLGSALFWIPLVRKITVSLRTMRDAAEQMAAGHFETRVPRQGGDELGTLADSLNHLAAQLEDFVTGQKRFLGDIAHELCSPVARMEWSLGVLEQQAGPGLNESVQDVREEVALMSRLIEELLCFTKAGLHAELHPTLITLADIVSDAVHQENIPPTLLHCNVPAQISVYADAHLLKRAISNVLRNAVRYSGGNLPVTVDTQLRKDCVQLSIADEGPGVPEEVIHRLCEPFFRPETARTRETGGTGLGLAIVKRAIEACSGTMSIRNRTPHGLCVEFTLPLKAPAPDSAPA